MCVCVRVLCVCVFVFVRAFSGVFVDAIFACDELVQTGSAIAGSYSAYFDPIEIQQWYNVGLFYLGLICVGAGTVLGVIYGALMRAYAQSSIPSYATTASTVDDHVHPLLRSTAAASTAGSLEEVVPLFYFAVPFLCVIAGTFVAFVLTWTGMCRALTRGHVGRGHTRSLMIHDTSFLSLGTPVVPFFLR